jgi:hypothetical protein
VVYFPAVTNWLRTICILLAGVLLAGAAPKKKSLRLTAQQADAQYFGIARDGKVTDEVFRAVLKRLRTDLRRKNADGRGYQALISRIKSVRSPIIGPERNQRLVFARDQMGALRMVYDEFIFETQPVSEVRKHPSADAFPGVVPKDAERISVTIPVNLKAYGKVGTGLYAGPGEVINVKLDSAMIGLGLKVRIGLHSTRLSLDKFPALKRFSSVSRIFDLKAVETKVANAFGGLIYLEMPNPSDPFLNVKKGDMENLVGTYPIPDPEWQSVVISGGVRAPRYVRGETSLKKWRESLRKLPGPWAELETDKVVFTLPSSMIRELEAPNRVMAKWDEVMDAMADLAGRPHQRPVAMRFMLDAHVNFGAAFAGYPINAPYGWADPIVTGKADWGHVHELGHMHQKKDWTYQGTGEVTVNLFSLYALEKVYGEPLERAEPARVQGLVDAWFKKPTAERNWMKGGGAWDKLAFYQLLIGEFGWAPFIKVFTDYRQIPLDKKLQADQNRAGDFMARFSREVGKNLEPYFRVWGVQLNPEYRAQVQGLPVWLPAQLPGAIRAEANR